MNDCTDEVEQRDDQRRPVQPRAPYEAVPADERDRGDGDDDVPGRVPQAFASSAAPT